MNNFATEGSQELEVTNFGPIIEAKIDLRPLTVFVGPSNTGKSYLAILIYALHQYFNRGKYFPYYPSFRHFEDNTEKLPQKTADSLAAWLEREFAGLDMPRGLSENRKRSLDYAPVYLPKLVAEEVRSVIDRRNDLPGMEVQRCFGTGAIGELIRKGSPTEASIIIRRQSASDAAPFEHAFTIQPQAAEFRTAIPESGGIPVGEFEDYNQLYQEFERFHRTKSARKSESGFVLSRIIGNLAALAMPQLFGPLSVSAYYLPADRTGVMHAHNVVVSALIESAAMTGLLPAARSPMLSGVLADFLEQLINFHRRPYRRSKSRKADGSMIEQAILGGSIQVNPSEITGYPNFTYQPDGWKKEIPLMNASSMVSELAPVVLYLRHVVRRNNVLIVEEPESHLHPAMQVEFTRQLAALVRSGIRVIITTHSEWVLEELSNLVLASSLPMTRRDGIGGGAFALEEKNVGVWAFRHQKRPRGTRVEEVWLDRSGHLYSSGFDNVSASTYNDWASIVNSTGDTWRH